LSTEPQDGINILNPRFSPDGKEILYQRGNNVWIMNTDGTNQHQLVSATSWSAIFSPDMKKLYYTNSGGAFIANADGTNAALIPLSAGDTVYGISPNGASIVLWNMSSETTYTANSDGSNLKQIASPADNPAW
jgi:Tol biopolymer transport system component